MTRAKAGAVYKDWGIDPDAYVWLYQVHLDERLDGKDTYRLVAANEIRD